MDHRVLRVVEILNNDFRNATPMKDIAQRLNISPSRLRHIFKAEMGISPTQYCKELRMSKAKELIETSFLNIKQIMTTVGASNKDSFARDFKKTYGYTPSTYRTRYHKKSGANSSASREPSSEYQPPAADVI